MTEPYIPPQSGPNPEPQVKAQPAASPAGDIPPIGEAPTQAQPPIGEAPTQTQPPIGEAPTQTQPPTGEAYGQHAPFDPNYVQENTDYYGQKYARYISMGSGGFNWAAFLLTPWWFFYRKMYTLGILMLLLDCSPFALAGNFFAGFMGNTWYFQKMERDRAVGDYSGAGVHRWIIIVGIVCAALLALLVLLFFFLLFAFIGSFDGGSLFHQTNQVMPAVIY